MNGISFPWSDNWWIEQGKAWFCGGKIGALFCVDMNTEQCNMVAQIPECELFSFRKYSYCIKYKNTVFCMPSMGNCIWCYDVESSEWESIEVENNSQIFICISSYKRDNEKMYFWDEEGKISETDFINKTSKTKCYIPKRIDEEIGEYVVLKDTLYCILGKQVFCINLDNEEIGSYDISAAKTGLYTICYDGVNFWLSGFCKEIYVWNPEQGIVKVITEFPSRFGIYNFNGQKKSLVDCDSFTNDEFPFFLSSAALGKYVWFIPFQTNTILYINKETYEVFELEIEGEIETQESLKKRDLANKYLIEYIREERYIGLYSIKNHLIFEIDTVELCVRKKDYRLSEKAILAMAKADISYYGQRIFWEKRKKDATLFSVLLNSNDEEQKDVSQNIGNLIYRTLDLL